jgi:hypothetical protein
MQDYEINVRAIVRATQADDDATGHIEGWEVYDNEAGEEKGEVVVRCDQLVAVKAKDEADAIEAAKANATGIEMHGYEIDDVNLWVDESIDVNPNAGAATPGM